MAALPANSALRLKEDPFLALDVLMQGISLPPHQQYQLREMWRATYIYSSSGRSTGKTVFTAIFLLLWCATHPGTKALCLGLKFTTPKLLLEAAEGFLKKFPEIAKCIQLTASNDFILHGSDRWTMKFKNGSVITALPSDINKKGARVRGFRCSILVIDEIAAIPSEIVRQVFMPCCSITDDEGYRKVIKLTTGGFRPSAAWDDCREHYRQVRAGNTDYAFFNFTYLDVPPEFNFIIDREAIENMIANSSPDEVAREVNGAWSEAGGNYYSGGMLERNRLAAINNEIYPETTGERGAVYVIGIDPAARGTDHTAMAVLKRLAPRRWAVVESVSLNFRKASMEENAKLLMEYIERYDPEYIGLDRNGGEQLIQEMKIYFKDRPDNCPINMDAESWERGRRICRQFVPTGTGKDNNTRLNARLLRALDGNGTPELLLPGSTPEDSDFERLDSIDKLQVQLLSIQATPMEAQAGLFKFSSTIKKDRYSALLYAFNAAEELVEGEEDFYGNANGAEEEQSWVAGRL